MPKVIFKSKQSSPNTGNVGKRWAESVDFILPLGTACRPARQLEIAGLRTFSAPLDWMMRYSLDLAASLIINGFEGFFSKPQEDEMRGRGKNNRYVIDAETGMVSMHDFPWKRSVDEEYLAFCEKMSRRGKRLHANVLAAQKIGILMNRQERAEVILSFARKISEAFPKQYFYILNIRDDKTLQRGKKHRSILDEGDSYSICEITFNDTHEGGDSPQANPGGFWLGDVEAWQKVILEEFSLVGNVNAASRPHIDVSVIIPCYNVEKYLRECLDTVVNQTLKNIEIICVDDGSTDSTPQILEEYAQRDSRIKLLYQKNLFAGVARNNGMKIAHGKYLCFLDSDDFFEQTMFEKMVTRAEEVDADIVICDFCNFFEDAPEKNWVWRVGTPKECLRKLPFFSAEKELVDLPVERFSFTPWNKLFRREFVESIGNHFSLTRSSNDVAFVSFALYMASRIAIVPETLLSYRREIKGTISSTRGKFLDTNIIAWKDLKARMGCRGIYEKFKSSFLRALTGSVLYELKQNPSIQFLSAVYSTFPEIPYDMRITIEQVFSGDNLRWNEPKTANSQGSSVDSECTLPSVVISIIIPVYNVEKYLERCLDSVVNQTLREIEIICVDDGSIDTSPSILRRYANLDSRIKIVSQKNKGQASARNAGIQVAKGTYIGFVDADDYVDSKMYERLFNEALKINADVVECSAFVEDAGGIDVSSVQSQQRSFDFDEWQMDTPTKELFFGRRFHAVLWNKIYKRSLLSTFSLLFCSRLRKGEDAVFQWEIMPFVKKYKRIKDKLYHYYYGRSGSVETMKDPQKTWEEFIEGCKHLRDFWEDNGLIDRQGDVLVWRLWNIAEWRLKYCFNGNVSGSIYWQKIRDVVGLFPSIENQDILRILSAQLDSVNKKLLTYLVSGAPSITVSLTSFPARIQTVASTIETLLAQTWKANRIVLWLADSQFPKKEEELPEALLALRKRGLEIRWCEDLKSYKKLIPALKAFPDDVIVTVDDDLLLESAWLEGLVDSYLKNPLCIHTHRAHGVAFLNLQTLAPYNEWPKEIKPKVASFCNFFTGVGGCLYPPGVFYKDISSVEKFQSLCPHGDDIWFWAMAVLAGTKICVTPYTFRLKHPEGTQEVGLWKTVNIHGENDNAIQRVLKAYPKILGKLERIYGPFSANLAQPVFPAKSIRENTCSGAVSENPKRLPRFLVRLCALFILNKAARKRWREEHMDLTPRDGIDINTCPELRRDSALKRFAVRVASLFIFSKSKRRAFRAAHLDLSPRDGVDVHALSPEERRLRKQKKRERNPLRRLFNAIVPATRSKISHSEKRLIRHMEWQTQQILAAVKSAQTQTERKLAELQQSHAQLKKQHDALELRLVQEREKIQKELTDSLKDSESALWSEIETVLTRQKALETTAIESYSRLEKRHPDSLEFRTFGDLAHCIRAHLHKIPADVDLVVGLPRSGMIPAYTIALFLNKKCCSLDEFLSGTNISHGDRPLVDATPRKVLVVDDSCYSGRAMDLARERLKALSGGYEFIYVVVYGRTDSLEKIDCCLEIVDGKRVWQWNYLNHSVARTACFDLDGVLCVDPTPEENDDGPKYLNFIKHAAPLYIPSYKIRAIVTSRLEKYRSVTEAWLQEHGVQYEELVMLNLPTAEERRRQNCHARFKADAYKARSGTTLFVESEERQAKEIAFLSGKEVLCIETDELY